MREKRKTVLCEDGPLNRLFKLTVLISVSTLYFHGCRNFLLISHHLQMLFGAIVLLLLLIFA